MTLTTYTITGATNNSSTGSSTDNTSDSSSSIHRTEQVVDTNFQVAAVVAGGNDDDDDDDDVGGGVKESTSVSSSQSRSPILSIVIPAYDEEQRLPTMLHAAYTYLNQTSCPAVDDLISTIGATTSAVTNHHHHHHHTNQNSYEIEWIVVNDGSKDQTSLVYEQFIQQHTISSSSSLSVASNHNNNNNNNNIRMQWKLVTFSKNCGKGAAVQAGMMLATGQFRLMVDADGATDFGPGLTILIQQLKQDVMSSLQSSEYNTASSSSSPLPSSTTQQQQEISATFPYPIIFGSRAHLHQSPSSSSPQQQQQKRSVLRSFLMQAFHVCVMLLVGTGDGGRYSQQHSTKRRSPIVDTQCGFKLFPAHCAQRLFSILHLQRWAFDIELVYIIQSLLYYDCIEVVVPWKEIDGSKLNTSPYNLAMVAICMLRDMICVRLCYTLGIWNVVNDKYNNSNSNQQQHVLKKDR
jgi:dolichyl-phosphate beta-glucosyltransferase